jgi:glutamyl-tRNA synthetase
MLRFAPSSNRDIDINDLKIALFNYIVSKQHKEDFIIKIEDIQDDTDTKDKDILDILALFGIEYTQVINQSQNIRFHTAMALQLMHEKKAFSCFCSDSWLDKKRNEAKANNKAYIYDDACRNLPAELVIDNENPFTVRIIRPNRDIIISDILKGDISFTPDVIDSFIVMNKDKTPTSDFSSAIDDMLNDISMIIRDEKYLKNSAKQEHIRDSLSYNKTIKYAHIPSISSNNENITIKKLLEDGYLPAAILNYLISTSFVDVSSNIYTLDELIDWFDLENISNHPTLFDINLLRDINKEYLKSLDAKELSRYVGFADEDIGELARIYLKNGICTTKELKSKISPIFEKREIPNDISSEVSLITNIIKKAPYFDKYGDFKDYIIKESGLDEEKFLKVLMVLLTNSTDVLEIEKVYKYLKNYIGELIK